MPIKDPLSEPRLRQKNLQASNAYLLISKHWQLETCAGSIRSIPGANPAATICKCIVRDMILSFFAHWWSSSKSMEKLWPNRQSRHVGHQWPARLAVFSCSIRCFSWLLSSIRFSVLRILPMDLFGLLGLKPQIPLPHRSGETLPVFEQHHIP